MPHIAITKRTYIFTFAGLVILTVLTTAVAFVDLGAFNTVAAMAIAAMKALLIALFFMHLIDSEGLVRLVAVGAVGWLAILVFLTATDYVTRGWLGVPGK